MVLIDWFQQHGALLGWLGVISVVTFFGTIAAVPMFLAALPEDYLKEETEPISARWPAPLRWGYRFGKNLVGAVLLLAGVAMLVLPGQGLLTIFVALVLMDVPGKRHLLKRFIGRPPVFNRINHWRQSAGRPPLLPPGP